MKLFPRCLLYIIKIVLRIRYRIKIEGKDYLKQLCREKDQPGILFLPNHTAYADPLILVSILMIPLKVRPAMLEDFYFNPAINWLMRMVNVLPVPDFTFEANIDKKNRYLSIEDEIVTSLKEGDNFILYPSGRLKRQIEERLEGCSAAHRISKKSPEARLVLIKTSGLWGSRLSYAPTKKMPNIGGVIKESIIDVFKNLIFFMPRRQITIEFTPAPDHLREQKTRQDFNRVLTQWYNQKEDSLTLVPYHFWSSRVPEVKDISSEKPQLQVEDISPEHWEEVREELARSSGYPKEEIELSDRLGEKLGLDSIEVAELIMDFSPDKEMSHSYDTLKITLVQDLFLYWKGHESTFHIKS